MQNTHSQPQPEKENFTDITDPDPIDPTDPTDPREKLAEEFLFLRSRLIKDLSGIDAPKSGLWDKTAYHSDNVLMRGAGGDQAVSDLFIALQRKLTEAVDITEDLISFVDPSIQYIRATYAEPSTGDMGEVIR